MSYLTENIKVLLWKNKGELSNKTYCEYINHVAQQCHMDPDYFRAILRDAVQPTGREVNLLRKYFEDYGYDLSAIQYRFLFEELLAKSGDDLLAKNIQYLLKSLTRGKNAKFIETIGVNPSTVSRWKQGTTKPDRDSQNRICQYFGYPDARILRSSFLFLGLEPVSTEQRKQQCKELINSMDRETFDRMYPALLKLLE